MSYSNVINFMCETGHEYAGRALSARVEKIKDELAKYRTCASEEPLDCQERDRQVEIEGIIAGLEKALVILGVETE